MCVVLHLATSLIFRSSRWPRRFLAGVAWLVGARISVSGEPVQPHTLLICNHTSWLDIFVMASATGCAFVSKQEIGNGFTGWLADMNGTLYVRRDQRRGASHQAEAIARKLRDPQPLALFPEGTTGPGDRLLPFRSTLFAAVTPPPPGVTVRPVAIDYGAAAGEIAWKEESGKANVMRMLVRSRPIPVTVRLLDPLPPTDDRKALARKAHEAIADALASSHASAAL